MTILDYYIMMSENAEINDIYYSTGDTQKEGRGKIFSFFNTNYRTLLKRTGNGYGGFGTGFVLLDEVVGKPYSEWDRYDKNNENKLKQHTVRMRKSELFSVDKGIYQRTKRGDVFERMLLANENELSDMDKRFLCYMLILTGYFSNIPNYIINRTKDAFKAFNMSGYSDSEILELQKDFINKNKNIDNVREMLQHDYAYLESFCFPYKDIDFNSLFKKSNDNDKQSLKNYVIQKLESKNTDCILSHKFVAGGNYTKTTLEESCMILTITKQLIDANIKSFEEFVDVTISSYGELYGCDANKIKSFIFSSDNISVFKVVYNRALSIPQEKMVYEENVREVSLDEHKKFDTTDENGLKESETFSAALKKLVKVNSGYKCIMDEIEQCKYFTAKESNQNYLEVHHFIPREFANDFEESIENKDNYIPLCPHCHRKIHLAVDAERKHMINYIYSIRKEALKKDNLIPENEKVEQKRFLDLLYEYYRIDR